MCSIGFGKFPSSSKCILCSYESVQYKRVSTCLLLTAGWNSLSIELSKGPQSWRNLPWRERIQCFNYDRGRQLFLIRSTQFVRAGGSSVPGKSSPWGGSNCELLIAWIESGELFIRFRTFSHCSIKRLKSTRPVTNCRDRASGPRMDRWKKLEASTGREKTTEFL